MQVTSVFTVYNLMALLAAKITYIPSSIDESVWSIDAVILTRGETKCWNKTNLIITSSATNPTWNGGTHASTMSIRRLIVCTGAQPDGKWHTPEILVGKLCEKRQWKALTDL
jgi:hypothetical protein